MRQKKKKMDSGKKAQRSMTGYVTACYSSVTAVTIFPVYSYVRSYVAT